MSMGQSGLLNPAQVHTGGNSIWHPSKAPQHVVGIADLWVCSDPGIRLVTYSLGSCIGLAIYDPVSRVGGMLHFMLPDSTIDPEKAAERPGMFADTGVPALFKGAYVLGLEKNRVHVMVAGGAQMFDISDSFNIGNRNYTALRGLLLRNKIRIDAEDVGGVVSRTLCLEMDTGKTWVKSGRDEVTLLWKGA